MNKEKLLSTLNRILASACAVVVCLFSLGSPSAYAMDSQSDLCLLPEASAITQPSLSSETASLVGMYDTNYDVYAVSTRSNTLFFAYVGAQNKLHYVYCGNPADGTSLTWGLGLYRNSTGVYQAPTLSNYNSSMTTDSTTGVCYYDVLNQFSTAPEMDYMFSSLAAGLAAAAQYDWPVPLSSTIEVPAGYVVYFKSSGTLSLSCKQNELSLSGSYTWPEAKQYYGYANSLPASNTTFPLSGSTLIPWSVGYPRDMAQRSYYSTSSVSAGSVYTYVFNQMMNYLSSDNPRDYKPNGSIFITGVDLSDIRLYPLYMTYDSSGGLTGYFTAISGNTGGYEDPVVGVVDPETGVITYEDHNGNVYVPSVGGENYMPESQTSQGFLDQIVGILKELLSSIGNLFGFAYEAVVSLVSLATPFVQKLGALYAWLPSPVFTALTSAMVLAITIGVLKAFL